MTGQAERLTLTGFVGWMERENPAAVIAMLSLPSIWGDCDAVAGIKRTLPKTKLIRIGPICVLFAHEILEKIDVDDR